MAGIFDPRIFDPRIFDTGETSAPAALFALRVATKGYYSFDPLAVAGRGYLSLGDTSIADPIALYDGVFAKEIMYGNALIEEWILR
jgi:hypothetical protein